MYNIFDKQRVNTGRQIELDIARGLAVIFMIAIHVLGAFSNEEVSYSLLGATVNTLGGIPAAPVFMFILGAGIVYSKKSDAKTLLKRGLLILIVGYTLNLIQGASIIYWYVITSDPELLSRSINNLLMINILQFAGLALMFFSFCKKFQLKNWMIFIIGILFIGSNLFLLTLKTDDPFLAGVSGLFWGSSNISLYPFLSWIIFPIAGYIFGTYLIRTKNKMKFYLYLMVSGLLLFAIFGSLTAEMDFSDPYTYLHQDISNT